MSGYFTDVMEGCSGYESLVSVTNFVLLLTIAFSCKYYDSKQTDGTDGRSLLPQT